MELEPQRILVAITGTVEGQRALEHGIRLAEGSGAAVLVGLVVEGRLPSAPATVAEVDDARQAREPFFDTIETLAIDQAAEHGIELEIRRRPGPFVRAVYREAHASGVDLVIIGRPRSAFGLPRIVSLIRRLGCPLLLTP